MRRFYRRARKAFMPSFVALAAVALLVFLHREGIDTGAVLAIVITLLQGAFSSLGVYRVPNERDGE